MYFAFIAVVAVSLALQIGAAWLAVRLIRVTGTNWAWLAIAAAMITMAIRRVEVLAGAVQYPLSIAPTDFRGEVIGLLNAALLFAGIIAIGPLFRTVLKAKDAAEQSHDRLQLEVIRQNSDLLAANEQLKLEVARRAEVEAALREEHRHLSRVLAIYEKDRQLVAYDIHDGFVQTAAAAQMRLQAALAAYANDPNNALEHVASAVQQLQQSLAQARSLIRGLRPVVLEESGLMAAIEQLVHDTRANSEIQVDWSSCVNFHRLSPTLEMSIFRIIQEGLTNAVRHSQSKRVEIKMEQIERTIYLCIEDWGRGFDPAATRSGHYGLEGIQARARLFGGQARIESEPGKGTRIEVELPLIERDS